MNSLKHLNNINRFNSFLKGLSPSIGNFGGRNLIDSNGTYKFNELVQTLDKIVQHENEPKTALKAIRQIRNLDQRADDMLGQKNTLIKASTAVRQLFGNFAYDREQTLLNIQFPNQKTVTSISNYQLLRLEGDQGAVHCRVRGISKNSFSTLSQNNFFDFLHRSFTSITNLSVVRGTEEDARMVGPCDHFGNIDNPNGAYTIQIHDGVPIFLEHKKETLSVIESNEQKKPQPPPSTIRQVEWISGNDVKNTCPLQSGSSVSGDTLFDSRGILKIKGELTLELQTFDATKHDLSSYKARLLKNDQPFHITQEKCASSDNYRVVSYQYQPKYADYQVKKGGGVFLETHSFAQTITPLNDTFSGFVKLAKWKDESKKELEIIAIVIPYGYTLVVEEYAIHGDATLRDMVMMCIPSNRKSMETADTVFLKSEDGTQNICPKLKGLNRKSYPLKPSINAPLPIVEYKQSAPATAKIRSAAKTTFNRSPNLNRSPTLGSSRSP